MLFFFRPMEAGSYVIVSSIFFLCEYHCNCDFTEVSTLYIVCLSCVNDKFC